MIVVDLTRAGWIRIVVAILIRVVPIALVTWLLWVVTR